MTTMAYAQKVVTPDVHALIDSSSTNLTDSSRTMNFANLAISEARKSKSNVLIAEAMCNKAELLKHFLSYSKAIAYYDKAIEAYEKEGMLDEVAELWSTSGRFYYELGDYKTAMERYMKGLTICEDRGLQNSTKGWLLRYIGSVFKRQDDNKKAMSYYWKSYAVFKELNDIDGMASSLNNIGNVYGNLGDDSLQMVYYQKALKLVEENGLNWRTAIILDNIGSIYGEQNEYELAMSYFDRALVNLTTAEEPDYTFLAVNMENRAQLYIYTKEYKKALEALKKAEFYISKTEKKQNLELSEIYLLYTKLFAEMNDYEKAYEYIIQYNEIHDLLYNENIALEVARLEFEHNGELLSNQEKAGQELEDVIYSNQKSWIIYLTIGFVALIVFSLIIFIQKRNLSLAYANLYDNLEKERELSDLKSRFVAVASHQFRTPLTVIKSCMSLFEYQKEAVDETRRPGFEKLTKRVHKQIDTMTMIMNQVLIQGKINSTKVEAELTEVNLVELIQESCKNINELQADGRKAELSVTGEQRSALLDANLLEHSISNLLNNAFIYSDGRPNPTVSILYSDSFIQINIKDLGIGIPEAEIKHVFEPFFRATNAINIFGTGLGASVSKEYIELMGGTITVESEEGHGTEFIITFKQGR